MDLLSTLKNILKNTQSNKERHINYLSEMDTVYKAAYKKYDKHSGVKVKDARNAVRSMKFRLINDFTNSESIVLPSPIPTAKTLLADENKVELMKFVKERSSKMKLILEHYFKHEFNSLTFLRDVADVLTREGMAVVRTGWLYDMQYLNKQKIKTTPEEYPVVIESISKMEDYAILSEKQLKNGNIEIVIAKKTVFADRPDAVLVPNSDFYIDPKAYYLEDAQFVIEKFKMSLSDIRKLDVEYNPRTGIFKNTDVLVKKIWYDNLTNSEKQKYGLDFLDTTTSEWETIFEENSPKHANRQVTLYKFVGAIDYDEDGIAEIREIIFTDNVILYNKERNSKIKLPYVVFYADKQAFEKYGNAFIVEGAKDFQKTRTAIMRSIVDWLATMSISQKFINLDMLASEFERKKLQMNIPASQIFVNGDPRMAMVEATTRDLPQALPVVYNIFGVEGQKSTGVNDMFQSGKAPSYNTTATEATISAQASNITYSYLFKGMSDGLKQLFEHWIELINEYIPDNEVINATQIAGGQSQVYQIPASQIKGKYAIDISITASGLDNVKIQQLSSTLQMAPQLIQMGAIPPSLPAEIYKQIEELMGNNYIAKKIAEWTEWQESTEKQKAVEQAVQQTIQQLVEQGVITINKGGNNGSKE